MLSTREIIYDARFQKGTFSGYSVDLPSELGKALEFPNLHNDNIREFREFLNSAGPYRFNYTFSNISGSTGTIYFSRERSAMMYKLKFL